MGQLNLRVGTRRPAYFTETDHKPMGDILVRGERTSFRVLGVKGLPGDTVFLGRLIYAERIHGRVTEARTAEGKRYPMCFRLLGTDMRPGLLRRPGDAGARDSALVFSTLQVEGVGRFEE